VRHREAEHLGGFQVDESSNIVDCITGKSAGFRPVDGEDRDQPSKRTQ